MGIRQVKTPQQVSVLHHKSDRSAVLKDVVELGNGCRRTTHSTDGTGPHQPLIHHQPTGAVLRKQAHHITRFDAELSEAFGSGGDPGLQLPVAEPFRMGRMGGIHGHDLRMIGGKPGPHLIHPAEIINVTAGSQRHLLAGGGTPAGAGGSGHGIREQIA